MMACPAINKITIAISEGRKGMADSGETIKRPMTSKVAAKERWPIRARISPSVTASS